MNPPQPTQPDPSASRPDPALSRTLQAWRIEPALPQDFIPEVHVRIRTTPTPTPTRHTSPWTAITRFLALLQRPAFAATYIAAGILLGGLSGSRLALPPVPQHPTTQSPDPDTLRSRYVASIDPYQMPRTPAEQVLP